MTLRTIFIAVCLIFLLAGCTPYYYQPVPMWQMYPPPQQPALVYPAPPPQTNYWQEQNARQQWWDNQYRKMGVPNP